MTNRSRSVSVSLAICALLMSRAPSVFADSLITITGVFDSIRNLPTDAATYLKFPQKTFSVGAFWGSGDYTRLIHSFQYDDSHIYYVITGVLITSVP